MANPIFGSYSTADTVTVEQIRDHLESQPIACWMAPRTIPPCLDPAGELPL
jgi:hypothetical protein